MRNIYSRISMEGSNIMKKLIGCAPGEWARKLFTLERFETLAYFVDDIEGEFGLGETKKKVYTYEVLKNEEKENLILIIADTRRYSSIKKRLQEYGFVENIHFFNGWKLNINYYHLMYGDEEWKAFEEKNENALAVQRNGWEKRAEELVKMIPQDVKAILDIGCGEGIVRKKLPSNIKYYGLDYCKRDDDTVICDINKERIPNIPVDLYYMAGVIEYIEDIPKFIKQLENIKYILISKVRNERFIRLDDKAIENGYLNYGIKPYYVSNLITDMFGGGYACKKMIWNYEERDEYYFLFEKLVM